MPERLAETINVKDWGAKGDGSSDDRPAIQNAINEAIRRLGGTLIFPPGNYHLNSAPGCLYVGSENPDIRVHLIAPVPYPILQGSNATGFLISRGSSIYDNIGRIYGFALYTGDYAAGLVKLEGTQQAVQNCWSDVGIPVGGCAVDASLANGALLSQWSGGCKGDHAANDPTPGPTTNTVAFWLGSGCVARDCRF